MLSPIQTRLLSDAPAAPARARRTRTRVLRGSRSRTLPLPLSEQDAARGRAAEPAGAPDPSRELPALRVVPAAPEISPVDLLGGILGEAGGVYSLTVRGDALADALVADGDLVMLQPGGQVTSGELAAVRLRGEGVLALRRVYFENGHVRLQPENHRYPPVVVSRADVEIEGRVLAIVRQSGR